MHSILFDFFINATTTKVYNYVSDPAHLKNWWPLNCSGQAKVGEVYNFYFTDEYDWFGEVVKSDPGQAFHVKMTKSDSDWDPTTFGFDLIEKEDATRLQFFHSNWPEVNEHFRFSSFCWAMLLNGLKNYIEKGVIVPFEERE